MSSQLFAALIRQAVKYVANLLTVGSQPFPGVIRLANVLCERCCIPQRLTKPGSRRVDKSFIAVTCQTITWAKECHIELKYAEVSI